MFAFFFFFHLKHKSLLKGQRVTSRTRVKRVLSVNGDNQIILSLQHNMLTEKR